MLFTVFYGQKKSPIDAGLSFLNLSGSLIMEPD